MILAGWTGDRHSSQHRQIFFILSGEISVKVGGGEDTEGKGHYTWVNGDTDVHSAVVQLG
ncbi:MAG: hypothetical protein JW712_11540 [Dehalococcoidales bacterium]|nr:hypothetical protein [Dehalococcoidales bacterium]